MIVTKYYRNYRSYIELYINNIQKLYQDDADILLVDNNSKYIDDINLLILKYNNVSLINNISNSKYEIGAYRYGIQYLDDKIKKYDYIIFTQDTFIINNKYDFNILKLNDTLACTIVSDIKRPEERWTYHHKGQTILNSANLNNNIDKISFCFSNSFILHNNVINDFMKYTNSFILNSKDDSGLSEDFLARVLYELNNHKNFDIDGLYNYNNKNINEGELRNDYNDINEYYFMKILQRKTENTIDE